MHQVHRTRLLGIVFAAAVFGAGTAHPALAASRKQINADATAALNRLYRASPAAKTLAGKAKGILIFPKILKAGFMVGAQGGEGVLRKDGKSVAYYSNVAASYGFQAGIQSFSYVLFLMTDSAVQYLDKSGGWELGSGPSLVIVDEGFAKSLSTTTLKDDVYAMIFGQKGLMGGIGLQGSKITRINPR